jgi:alpha-D-xyloside xylohydrolase
MFLDFPEDEAMFSLATQFMFGDNILVAPKLGTDNQVIQLPYSANWYNFNTKLLWTECSPIKGSWPVMQMPVFYRAGSIFPILLHRNALSLLRAINNNIAIEVYPTL